MKIVVPENALPEKEYTFARVYQSLDVSAKLKVRAEDFVVEEYVPIEFSQEGEHCWLYIKKQGCNTDWLAQRLAVYCGVKKMAVAYAGLKDRHAVTSQWFSVQLPGKPTPNWADFESEINSMNGEERVQVLKSVRHNRKLQRGALKHNFFKIILRDLSDNSDEKIALLTERCQLISREGVPNYFGAQRFGRNYNNLAQSTKLFSISGLRLPRHKRSIYLSTARSWLFNCILSERIQRQLWNKRLSGDVFMLDGKSACFKDDGDEGINQRLIDGEIHPTAPLWGEGDQMVTDDVLTLENQIINQFLIYKDGLMSARLQIQRRACRVIPKQLEACKEGDDFIVSFSLPAGCYATMVLAEIFSELVERS